MIAMPPQKCGAGRYFLGMNYACAERWREASTAVPINLLQLASLVVGEEKGTRAGFVDLCVLFYSLL